MNNTYNRQMDMFCDKNITLTAEDILSRAKQTEPAKQKAQPKKRLRPMLIAAAAAACFLVVGGTAVAFAGGWGAFISTLFGDDTTAQIADEGYISEISQKASDGAFSVDLLAGTGDQNKPKLIFDVTVSDESIASDKILMTAYVLSKEVYENDIENYAPCEAYGYRDSENKNLYHVLMDAPYSYFANPTEVVIDVCSISTSPDSEEAVIHETDMRFDISSGDINLQPVHSYYPDATHYEYGDITYELIRFTSGEYDTELNFRFALPESAKAETNRYAIEASLEDDWHSFAEQIVLTVDGKDYNVHMEQLSTVWYDEADETGAGNYCYVTAYMPTVGIRNADKAVLTIGDVTCTVK